MPEGLEVELYRRAAERAVGRTIRRVSVDERLAGPDVAAALPGTRITGSARVGKQLLLPTTGPTLGLHFGMTGRIVVDELAPIERLEYGAGSDQARWDRLCIEFADGGALRVNDPRRWARFVLEPDVARLGPDLLTVGLDELSAALGRRRAPLKAVLLDQSAIAGLGNMCVDEVLWHASLAPARPARELDDEEVATLHEALRTELPAMLARGGSHTGTLSPDVRASLPACLLDGAPLRRSTVGGRTTIWCDRHQH